MEKVRIWEHQGLSGSSQVSRELVFPRSEESNR